MDKPFTNGAGFRMPSMHSFFCNCVSTVGPAAQLSLQSQVLKTITPCCESLAMNMKLGRSNPHRESFSLKTSALF